MLAQAKVWCAQREQIERIEAWIHDDIRRSPELAGLNTVPGIGAVLGTTILFETGPISRFASVGHYASYCRMVKTAPRPPSPAFESMPPDTSSQ